MHACKRIKPENLLFARARVFNIEITSRTLRQGNEGDSLYGE